MTQPLHIAIPEPGFYRRKLVKGGPWVPILVYRPCPIEMHSEWWQPVDRWPLLACLVDGRPGSLVMNWPYLEPITEAEYLYLTDTATYCRRYDPAAPEANPREPVNLGAMAPIF